MWQLQLYFYPSAGGFKKNEETGSIVMGTLSSSFTTAVLQVLAGVTTTVAKLGDLLEVQNTSTNPTFPRKVALQSRTAWK